jgi:hypothetical protein
VLVSGLTFDRGWGDSWRRLSWLFSHRVTNAIVFRFVVNIAGVGRILSTESELLAAMTLPEALEEFFQFVQLKNVIAHRLVGEDLSGCRPASEAQSALLPAKKKLAEPNELLQFLQAKDIVTQLLGLSGLLGLPGFPTQTVLPVLLGAGRGGGVVLVALRGSAFLRNFAKASQLLEGLQAARLNNLTQEDELFELEVATLSFEELMPGLVEQLKELLEGGPLRIAGVAVIARHRRHRRDRG